MIPILNKLVWAAEGNPIPLDHLFNAAFCSMEPTVVHKYSILKRWQNYTYLSADL